MFIIDNAPNVKRQLMPTLEAIKWYVNVVINVATSVVLPGPTHTTTNTIKMAM